ncbi:hypothetical protein HanRHA438_Chr04g0180811 [Helianthus annuus]|nr:hypothetical protein HanRHA438_Chr04g0180811 [Helianthus annuus]
MMFRFGTYRITCFFINYVFRHFYGHIWTYGQGFVKQFQHDKWTIAQGFVTYQFCINLVSFGVFGIHTLCSLPVQYGMLLYSLFIFDYRTMQFWYRCSTKLISTATTSSQKPIPFCGYYFLVFFFNIVD